MKENAGLEQALQSMSDKLIAQVRELEFQVKGFSFTAIRTRSAKEVFGQSWEEKVREIFSADDLFLHGDRDGLKLYDVSLAEVISEQKQLIIKDINRFRHLSEEEQSKIRITISVTAGDPCYNGTHRVLHATDKGVVIPVMRKGDAQGNYSNTQKVEQGQAKIKSLEERIADIRMQMKETEIPQQPIGEPVLRMEDLKKEEPIVAKKKFPVMHVLIGLGLVAGVVYFLMPENAEIKMTA